MSKFKVGMFVVNNSGFKGRVIWTERPALGGEVVVLYDDAGIGYYGHDSTAIREYREPREVWVMYAHGQGLPIDVAAKYCNDSRWVKFREVIE